MLKERVSFPRMEHFLSYNVEEKKDNEKLFTLCSKY